MSGPYILQTLFSEVAGIIVSQVFIKILGFDKLSITETDFENLIQSFTGLSISQLQGIFNVDLAQAFSNPSIVNDIITNSTSKINCSAFDYSNNSSSVNESGLGGKFKAILNIGESFQSSFISLMGLQANLNTDREKLKSAIEFEFVWFMVSDMISQIIDIVKSKVPDPHDTPYHYVVIELANLFWSLYLYGQGLELKTQLTELKNGDIVGTISELEGLSKFWVDLITPIADFFRLVLYDLLTSNNLKFFTDLVKLY